MMSAWLSWANQATTMWTSAVMSATRRQQAAMARELAKPPKPGMKAKPRKRASRR